MDDFQFYAGKPLEILDQTIYHPTLREIRDLEGGYEEYRGYVGNLATGVKDIADFLWVEGQIWYEDFLNDWEYFLQKEIAQENLQDLEIDYEELRGKLQGLFVSPETEKALNFFLKKNWKYVIISAPAVADDHPQFFLGCCQTDEKGMLFFNKTCKKFTEAHYNYMVDYLKKINFIKDDYTFLKGGNRYAKEYILKQNYKKRKKKVKQKITFQTILSSIVGRGIPYTSLWDMPIYAVFDCYYRMEKIVEYHSTLDAAHAGAIDTNKPIDWEEINWSTVINFDRG